MNNSTSISSTLAICLLLSLGCESDPAEDTNSDDRSGDRDSGGGSRPSARDPDIDAGQSGDDDLGPSDSDDDDSNSDDDDSNSDQDDDDASTGGAGAAGSGGDTGSGANDSGGASSGGTGGSSGGGGSTAAPAGAAGETGSDAGPGVEQRDDIEIPLIVDQRGIEVHPVEDAPVLYTFQDSQKNIYVYDAANRLRKYDSNLEPVLDVEAKNAYDDTGYPGVPTLVGDDQIVFFTSADRPLNGAWKMSTDDGSVLWTSEDVWAGASADITFLGAPDGSLYIAGIGNQLTGHPPDTIGGRFIARYSPQGTLDLLKQFPPAEVVNGAQSTKLLFASDGNPRLIERDGSLYSALDVDEDGEEIRRTQLEEGVPLDVASNDQGYHYVRNQSALAFTDPNTLDTWYREVVGRSEVIDDVEQTTWTALQRRLEGAHATASSVYTWGRLHNGYTLGSNPPLPSDTMFICKHESNGDPSWCQQFIPIWFNSVISSGNAKIIAVYDQDDGTVVVVLTIPRSVDVGAWDFYRLDPDTGELLE